MSDASSAPPSVAGDAVPAGGPSAAAAPQQHPQQHPLWRRAAGQAPSADRRTGRTGRTGGPQDPPPTTTSRFAPISMIELEIRARNELDGASSVASDDGKRRRGAKLADYGDDEASEAEAPRPRSRKRPRHEQTQPCTDDEDDDVANVANAAFGLGPSTALSIAQSDTDDSVSVTSSTARAEQRRAFPLTGITCVGCAMPTKVVAIDDFVRTSCDKMTEHALYKMAALVYRQKVIEPATAEGVSAPEWNWKDMRAHYTLHRIDPRMQRLQNVRCLQLMRSTLELQLLREDEEGERSLDHGNTDKVLKVTQQLSREISLLNEGAGAGPAGASKAGKK